MNALELRRRTLGKGVYKKTVEGNPAIAQGSLARRYPGIGMKGWTEQESYEGKNLFDIPSYVEKNSSYYELGENGGLVQIASDGRGMAALPIVQSLPTGTYYLYVNSRYDTQVAVDGAQIASSTSGPTSFHFDGETEVAIKCYYSAQAVYPSEEYFPIIYTDGSAPTPWEPYTGGKPSPNPDYPQEIVSAGNWNEETQKWEYEIEVGGANLFDVDKAKQLSSWIGTSVYRHFDIQLKPNTTYTLFVSQNNMYTGYKEEYDGNFAFYLGESENTAAPNILFGNTAAAYAQPLSSYTFTTTEVPYYINLYVNPWNEEQLRIAFDELLVNVMLVEGSSVVPYEPYRTPQTILLTSDRPLTKWDKLEKRGGQWGWVYKSNKIVLDGSKDEYWQHYSDIYEGFSSNLLPFIANRREGFSKDIIIKTGDSTLGRQFEAWLGVGNSRIYIVRVPQYDLELPDKGLQNWIDWLSENPITILTYLDEETFIPLSASEQEQMNELYTFRPTTVLSNDAGCEMSLTYKTKKSLEVTT